jgi:phage-related protein
VRLAGRVYVLHAFQKKSKHEIETAKGEIGGASIGPRKSTPHG